jgi:hypothetical protein
MRYRSGRRDWLVRFVVLAVLFLTLAVQNTANASVMWCRSDPVVVIDGYITDVFVSVPVDSLTQISGETRIVIVTPPDVSVRLATPGVGFGFGEDVIFRESSSLEVGDSGMEIRVKVLVPAESSDVPVRLEVSPRIVGILSPTVSEGNANEWVVQKTTI